MTTDYNPEFVPGASEKRRASDDKGNDKKKMVLLNRAQSLIVWSLENRRNYTPSLRQPHDVAFTDNGELLVSDGLWPHSSIKLFTPSSIRPKCFFSGKILPFGIEPFDTNTVLVSDHHSRSIYKCDLEMSMLKQWSDYDFSWPLGVSKCADRVYVADSEKNAIIVLDDEGKFISEFSTKSMQRPEYLTVSNDVIFVTDSMLKCIQMFDTHTGTYLGSIGKNLLKVPKGIAFRNSKQLVVADWLGDKIYLLSLTGNKLLESMNCLENEISYPRGLSVRNDIIGVSQQKLKAPPALKLIEIRI